MNIRMLGANVRTAMVASLSAALPGYFGALGAQAFLRPRPHNGVRHWRSEFEGP